MYKQGKKVRFKKYGEMGSVEGKTNSTGIRYKDGNIVWNGLVLRTIVKRNDVYAHLALRDKIKFVRIKREWFKDKHVYYAQLVLEGIPPKKYNNEGVKDTKPNESKVGVDIGTSTVAVCSENGVFLTELAPSVVDLGNRITMIQRVMDRSKKAMNPLKYKEDGTVDTTNKSRWCFSKRYMKKKNQLKELQRLNKVKRKQDHEILSNRIISLGTNVIVETMSFKGLQKRTKETTVNERGKFNTKKRFGRTISNRAPSMLLSIIDRKLKYADKNLKRVNTILIRASQYNHIADTYEKKKLHQRWNNFHFCKIQRDLYSAFLLMNCNDNLQEIDRELCVQNFKWFREKHDLEVQSLKAKERTPISMGV
ncbi:transposase [Bacillus dakarensis]|uniref:transposase n=1 Tax=Robertmurraya dakarensis TaxID=1926278 RepID=UPI001F47F333|nr:transposase [Bacillus dakarensis]